MKTEEIILVTISLYVGGAQSLFILLADDGTINRSGTGTRRNKDKTLFIKREKENFFQDLMKCVPEDWSKLKGIYKTDIPDKKGANCELQIIFKDKANKDYGFVVLYGSKSYGPAQDIYEIVVKAVEITDPWFNEQKQILKKTKQRESNKKPWWKP
jgi:hypothetical protein